MAKYRTCYAAFAAAAVVFVFWFNSYAALTLAVILVLLPVLMRLCLHFYAGGIRMSAQLSGGCRSGEDIGLSLTAKQGRFRLFAGTVMVTVEFCNRMFDTVTVQKYRFALKGDSFAVTLPYTEEACGLVEVCFAEAVCTDLFGVTTKRLSAPKPLRITVYPRMVAMKVLPEKHPHGVTGKERYDNTKKGTDVSEIFDLRDYQAGDPMHLIHWKLSQKTDTMIVREPGNPSQFDTLLYFDMGLMQDGLRLGSRQIAAVAAAGVSVSENLLRSGIVHCVFAPWERGISHMPVSDRSSYARMQEDVMGMRLQKECGEKLPLLMLEDLRHIYSKMIYVTWGTCPQLLDRLAEDMDITVLLLHDAQKRMATIVDERISVITLSDDQLYETSFVILI